MSRLKRAFATVNNVGGGYYQTGHRPSKLFRQHDPKILVTGAFGQIGTELIPALRDKYGTDNVIASDVKAPRGNQNTDDGPFVYLDVCDYNGMARTVCEFSCDMIFHMGALLSATGERDPKLAIKINNIGTENVLECARLNDIRVYIPSSIAAFGPTTPQDNTPNLTVMRPTTIYGITKIYTELLGEYYHKKYNVDFRSLRYPGIISNKAMPGGGTTDYAVEIYHDALTKGKYKCFLNRDQILPMMYMPDCIKATMDIMSADNNNLTERVYNVTGCSFTPNEQYLSIKEILPDFNIEYHPDFRQEIAQTWPHSIDDYQARMDWNWDPKFDLHSMTKDMLDTLSQKYNDPNQANLKML